MKLIKGWANPVRVIGVVVVVDITRRVAIEGIIRRPKQRT